MAGTYDEKMRQLEGDVRAARGDLTATIDELTGWFDPRTRVSAAVDSGRRLVHDAAAPDADREDRIRARVVLGVAAALAAAVVTGIVRRIARH